MKSVDPGQQGREMYYKFVDEIINQNRFFTNQSYLKFFEIFIKQNQYKLDEGKILYRGRIHDRDVTTPFSNEQLGMPKPHISTSNGRANPYGINYMYLSENPETVIAEVRPIIGDFISVGQFKATKQKSVIRLNREVSISGSIFEEWDSLTVSNFMIYLSLSFARPIDMKKKELEYLPTQYFAEYCKQQKVDGIMFLSSLMEHEHIENYNYVFFDDLDINHISTNVYYVNGLKYSSTKV